MESNFTKMSTYFNNQNSDGLSTAEPCPQWYTDNPTNPKPYVTNNSATTCYENTNMDNSTSWHPKWGPEYCKGSQTGGLSEREAYKLYKKYKRKYKNLKK